MEEALVPQILTTGKILDFLANNGASIFAGQLQMKSRFKQFLDESRLTMILAPTDKALNEVASNFGLPIGEFLSRDIGEEIIANHLTIKPTQKVYPMITAVNNTVYGSGPQDLTALEPKNSLIIDRVPIIVIDKTIVHESQYPNLTLNSLGRDPLFLILQRSQPMDVLNSCRTTSTFARLCRDPGTFRQLMALHYPQYPINRDARQQYTDITLKNGYAYYVALPVGDFSIDSLIDGSFAAGTRILAWRPFKNDETTSYLSTAVRQEMHSQFQNDVDVDDLALIKIYGNGLDEPTQFWVPVRFTSSETIIDYPYEKNSLASTRKEDVARYISNQVFIDDLIDIMIENDATEGENLLYQDKRLYQGIINRYLEENGFPVPLNRDTIFDRLMKTNSFWEFPDSEWGWGLIRVTLPKTP